jgi:hypothetical protein
MLGRILRRGQKATVAVYRLVLLNTVDVTLNNLSYSKEVMMTGFLAGVRAEYGKSMVLGPEIVPI